uniref:Uncharacterized protein n=1 Tax=Steinernema glaseri TaxID=37863 RepID=A0A1I7ZIM1_9BILA
MSESTTSAMFSLRVFLFLGFVFFLVNADVSGGKPSGVQPGPPHRHQNRHPVPSTDDGTLRNKRWCPYYYYYY